MKYQGIELKPHLKAETLLGLSPNIIIVLGHFAEFCRKKNLPCVISSLNEDVPGRLEKCHSEGRAYDASTLGFTTDDIDNLIVEMGRSVGHLGAVSKKDNVQRVVIYHKIDGGKYHFHFQVKS